MGPLGALFSNNQIFLNTENHTHFYNPNCIEKIEPKFYFKYSALILSNKKNFFSIQIQKNHIKIFIKLITPG